MPLGAGHEGMGGTTRRGRVIGMGRTRRGEGAAAHDGIGRADRAARVGPPRWDIVYAARSGSEVFGAAGEHGGEGWVGGGLAVEG